MNASLTQTAPFLWLLLAVAFEIAGTYLLKLSDGMSRRLTGIGGIARYPAPSRLVRNMPGSTIRTRKPNGANSPASASDIASSACLAAL